MGCTQQKPKRYHQQQSNNYNNNQQCDNTTINNQKSERVSQAEVTKNTTAAKFPERAILPNLENKQVVIYNDHFLKQTVQVPVLQPVDQSSLFAHRISVHKIRANSLSPKTTPNQRSHFALQQEMNQQQVVAA